MYFVNGATSIECNSQMIIAISYCSAWARKEKKKIQNEASMNVALGRKTAPNE